jgi:hypothetical protein
MGVANIYINPLKQRRFKVKISTFNRETKEHKFYDCENADMGLSSKGTPQLVLFARDGETFKDGYQVQFVDIDLTVEGVSFY